MTLYLITVFNDVEPSVEGPFKDETDRDRRAHEYRAAEGDDHGIFMLDINDDGMPSIEAYSGSFFEEGADPLDPNDMR